MIALLLDGAKAVGLALALGAGIGLAFRYSSVGLALLILVFFVGAAAFGDVWFSEPVWHIRGLNVHLADVVFLILTIAGGLRLLQRGRWVHEQWMWILFGSLALLSFVRGMATYGLQQAGVESRGFLYFVSATLYFMTTSANGTQVRRVARIWLGVAILLVALAVVRWTLVGLGLATSPNWATPGQANVLFRVMNAAQAFFLAQGLFVVVFLAAVRGMLGMWRYAWGPLALVVVFLQHRSVWVVALLTCLWVIASGRLLRTRLLRGATLAAILVLVPALLVQDGGRDILARSLETSVREAADVERSTLVWRVESWRSLLAGWYLSGWVEQALGRPFGTGYSRFVREHLVEVSPHNFYVTVLLRTGLLGLAVLLAVYVQLLRRLWTIRGHETWRQAYTGLLQVLLLGQLVYFIVYSPGYEQGVWLGLAIATVASLGRQQCGSQDTLCVQNTGSSTSGVS